LIAICRERLAGFETPWEIIFVDSLPETVGGKVLGYKLRAAYADRYRAHCGLPRAEGAHATGAGATAVLPAVPAPDGGPGDAGPLARALRGARRNQRIDVEQ